MRDFPQIQKFISVIMIFIILAYLSGCKSTRIISKSDLPLPDSSRYFKYPYVVHGEKSDFLLGKSTISDGRLSGAINQIDKSYHSRGKIHFFISSDSAIKIDNGEILSVQLDKVTRVELTEPSATKTILAVAYGVAAGGLFIYGLVMGISWLFTAP
jgi:hypothetical protein